MSFNRSCSIERVRRCVKPEQMGMMLVLDSLAGGERWSRRGERPASLAGANQGSHPDVVKRACRVGQRLSSTSCHIASDCWCCFLGDQGLIVAKGLWV